MNEKMTCEEAGLLLSRNLDGDLNRKELRQLYSHVGECDGCREKMEDLGVLEGSLEELNKAYSSQHLDDKFNEKLRAAISSARQNNLEPSENELKAEQIISRHVYGSAAAGLIPIPIVDLISLSSIQLNMVRRLANLYGVDFKKDLAKSMVGALVGSSLPVLAAGNPFLSLIKVFPIVGHSFAAATLPVFGGAAAYAVGKVFVQHFESGGTFLSFDPAKVQAHFAERYQEGKKLVSSA